MASDPIADPEPGTSVATPVARLRARAAAALRWLTLHALVAALSLGAGLLAVALATEYGYHPVRNATTWALRPLAYTASGACGTCHAPQTAAVAERGHDAVRCEACHGPLQDHAAAEQAAGGVAAATTAGQPVLAEAIVTSTSTTACLVCHEQVLGRPAGFPTVSTTAHFGEVTCTLCHDPHATTAAVAPVVKHDLTNLPDCLVCHGPDRVRPMPAAHPAVGTIDCLACHLPREVSP